MGKEEIKLFLFEKDFISVENPKHSTQTVRTNK